MAAPELRKHFVYIIYSPKYDKFYRGYSTQPKKRLQQHNNAECRYTKPFLPWILVYTEAFDSKSQALKREKSLKKYSKKQIRQLIHTKQKQ